MEATEAPHFWHHFCSPTFGKGNLDYRSPQSPASLQYLHSKNRVSYSIGHNSFFMVPDKPLRLNGGSFGDGELKPGVKILPKLLILHIFPCAILSQHSYKNPYSCPQIFLYIFWRLKAWRVVLRISWIIWTHPVLSSFLRFFQSS